MNEGLDIEILPKLVNPGTSNSQYEHCLAITHFQGKQLIAYGSLNNVVIISSSFSLVDLLKEHENGSEVTSVAWSPFSRLLASWATDNYLIIWTADNNSDKWIPHKQKVETKVVCLSWSKGNNVLCAAGEFLQIFSKYSNKTLNTNDSFFNTRPFIDNCETTFCSHSRDSRFILTLPRKNKGVLLYYKSRKPGIEYEKLLLHHPSPVILARWKNSENPHEKCCCMTVSEDHVVRIWYETGVNERLQFSVVASLKQEDPILTASFITPISTIYNNHFTNASKRKVDENDTFHRLSRSYLDKYAYGHGHYPKRDRNYRESITAQETEMSQNRFYFLTCNNKQEIQIWEIDGLSSDVRRTPTIGRMCLQTIRLGIEPTEVNHIFASCRVANEYSENSAEEYIGRPVSISLILQNKQNSSLTMLEMAIQQQMKITKFLNLNGHHNPIKFIRMHKDYPFMVTIDKSGDTIIWECNNNEVYDPTILARFICSLTTKLVACDWLNANRLLGFNGTKFQLIDMTTDQLTPIIDPETVELSCDFTPPKDSTVINFRVLCEYQNTFLFYVHFPKDLYVFHLENNYIDVLKHIHENDGIVDSYEIYISQLFHFPGASICLFCTPKAVYSVILRSNLMSSKTFKSASIFKSSSNTSVEMSNSVGSLNNMNDIGVLKCIELPDKNIRSIAFTHPAYLFIACDDVIYVCRRMHSNNSEVKIFQTIQIDFIPKEIRCNPNGMISLISDDKIDLYHQYRPSNQFRHSNLKWGKFASYKQPNYSMSEWSSDGVLMCAIDSQLFAFTKYMNTFFLDESKLCATIHNSLAAYSKPIVDFSPTILIPLAISGRIDLVLHMLDYFNENYENNKLNWFYRDYVLNYCDKNKVPYTQDTQKLINELLSKITKQSIPSFSQLETEMMITFLHNLPNMLAIKADTLDQRALIAARAFTLNPKCLIPFDLINLAHISHDQNILLECIDFLNWESILKSGVFFWMKNLNDLTNKIVPFAVKSFKDNRGISIIILVLTKKFIVLRNLFQQALEKARAEFFGRDFSKPKEKKAAEKNGYSALGKHDYHTSAAMFCLAGDYDLCLRILMVNCNEIELAYFASRCFGITNDFIDKHLMPKSIEVNDQAAIQFFNKQKNSDYQYDMNQRIRSEDPGNLFESSDWFCDTRFGACEVLPTSVEQKSELCLSFMLAGELLLSVIYLNYLSKYVMDDSYQFDGRSTSFESAFKSLSFEYSENETDDQLEEVSDQDSSNSVKLVSMPTFSFGYNDIDLSGSDFYSSSDEEDEVEVKPKSSLLKFDMPKSQQEIPKQELPKLVANPLQRRQSLFPNANAMKKDEPKESFVSFGAQKSTTLARPIDKPRHETRRQSSTLEMLRYKNKISLLPSTLENSSMFENSKFRQIGQQKLKNRQSINENQTNSPNQSKAASHFLSDSTGYKQIESDSGSASDDENAETKTDTVCGVNWFFDVIVFSIGRLRLKSFMVTKFESKEQPAALIAIKIKETTGNISSMLHNFVKFLIKSCKRNGIVTRRLLLMSKDSDRLRYIRDLCNNLADLPSQLLAFKFTGQQITQFSRTTQILIISILNEVVSNLTKLKQYPYLVSCILTAILVVAVNRHDMNMLLSLLSIKLDFGDSLFTFFESIVDSLGVVFLSPTEFSTAPKNLNWQDNYVSCLSEEQMKSFVNSKDKPILPFFASSVIDFMVIDTFTKKIQEISKKSGVNKMIKSYFSSLLMNLQNVHNSIIQMFTYFTLNFQSFIEFGSIQKVCQHQDESVNKLVAFMISQDNRESVLTQFCTNKISRFSLKLGSLKAGGSLRKLNISTVNFENISDNINPTHKSNSICKMVNKFDLDNPKIKCKYNSSVRSICLKKKSSTIILSTDTGIKMHEINLENDSQINEETGLLLSIEVEGIKSVLSDKQDKRHNSDNEVETDDFEIETDDSVPTQSSSQEFENEVKTDVKHRKHNSKTKQIKEVDSDDSVKNETPLCIVSSPSEDSILIGYKNGRVELCYFDDTIPLNGKKKNVSYKHKITLKKPNNVKCTSLAFSSNGQLCAASHKNKVSIWSINFKRDLKCTEKEPFNVFDTFSEECSKIVFLRGTGLIATAQVESAKLNANLCFWDILLPTSTSLIASLEIKGNYGRILSMVYSPSYSKIIIGTSHGICCVVDTKQFQIISVIDCFTEKNREMVESMAIDDQQLYFVTGSSNGNLKVWDIQTSKLLCEKKDVHNKKMYRSKGKLKNSSISSIAIHDRTIFTSGFDGNVKSMYLNLSA